MSPSPRARTVFRCAQCGAESAKWSGQCGSCGEWNTLTEERAGSAAGRSWGKGGGGLSRGARGDAGGDSGRAHTLGALQAELVERWRTGIDELDFVLGGGLVPGSVVLIGGEPGIGKSTLLLQVAAALQASALKTLYVSGEESGTQVRLRSDRLERRADDVALLADTSLETMFAVAEREQSRVVVVDSIQTLVTDELEGAPGSVGQVRETAARLMRFAKERGVAVLMVGHVTKDGGIAGPKTLEHIVDTVLYFEGEGGVDHRVLRATKNRFGSVDEIAVFRMTERGLEAVARPSTLFLGDRDSRPPGSAVAALIEGTRPLLVEVQALAAKAGFGTPQRVAAGFDNRRLALLLAVLDKRAGVSFAQTDVFLNVVGGLRMVEPAGDLAVAAALASSMYDRALPADAVFIGEVGLGGEVRGVHRTEHRIAEAEQLGFKAAYVAERAAASVGARGALEVRRVADLGALFRRLFAAR